MNRAHNTIVITGGATGIGFGLAQRFIQEQNTVIICGRRQEALKEAQKLLPSVIIRQCDLSVPAERVAFVEWLRTHHPQTNVLINNAGIQQWMSIDDDNFFERAQEEITTNIDALVHLTSLCIKLDSISTIMNVSSGLAFVPFAKTPVYSGTKAFVHSFTIALRYLLAARNIEVIEIIPPAINTDLGGKGLHDHAPPVSDFIESIFEQLHQGRTELTFGLSTILLQAVPAEVHQAFARLNPPQ